jgi:uncharacterized protein YlxW (UPF0749 family)
MSQRVRPDSRVRLGRGQWAVSIGLALLVVGFVGAAQWNSSGARQQFTSSAQQALTSQALGLQREQEDLRDLIVAEEAKVLAFQEQDAGSRTELEQLNAEVAAARLAAGLSDVRGPGLIIEIADSRLVVPAGEYAANYIVLVDDLQDIVTALWASGAEAITINGERLVATSSIYGVGASILVNTAFLSPPFRIEAIGADGIHERFLGHPAYQGRVAQRIDAYGLEFASEPAADLVLPAFRGSTTLRWAVPALEPS